MARTRSYRVLPTNAFLAAINANMPSDTNPFATMADIVAGSTYITVVPNYSALPAPNTVTGDFYWVENSQGTPWLPGSLGGTYYPKGLYYSNGVSWIVTDAPYQASQAEVNAGIIDDKFITPLTYTNSAQLAGKSDVGHTHPVTDIIGFPDLTIYQPTVEKDQSFGYVGLTGYMINIKNVLGTVSSFIRSLSTSGRIHTLPDRDGTLADDTDLAGKQATLVSGTNIKTVNGTTLLGAGNLSILQGDTLVTEGALINSATDKATPVDADMIGLMDSQDSNILKKLSWSNLKVALTVFFAKVRGNYVLVKTAADLPVAVAGIRTLLPNHVYDYNGAITTSDQIQVSTSNLILGLDKSNDKHIYTGVLQAFIGTNQDLTIRTMTLAAPAGKIFGLTGTTNKTQIRNCIFGSSDIGFITGGDILIFQEHLITTCSQGLVVSGILNKFVYVDNISIANTGTFTGLSIPSGTFQSILINRNNIDSLISQTAINISTSVVTASGLIDSNVFTGVGTAVAGIDSLSPVWVFRDNQGSLLNSDFSMPLLINRIARSFVTSGATFVTNNVAGSTSGTLASAMNNNTDYTSMTTGAVIGNSSTLETTNFTEFRTNHNPVYYGVMETGAVITGVRIWAGMFTATPTNADDLAGSTIAFRFSTVAGDVGWTPIIDNAGVVTTGTTIGVVAPSTQYKFKIRVDIARTRTYFSVNGGAEQTVNAVPTGTIDMGFAIKIFTTLALAKTMLVSRISVIHN